MTMDEKLPAPGIVISALQILTTGKPDKQTGTNNDLNIEDRLLRNIDQLEESLKSVEEFKVLSEVWKEDVDCMIEVESSPGWRFTQYCLKGLHLLTKALNKSISELEQPSFITPGVPAMSTDTLSFPEQKVVRGAVQFVVGLGMCPNMEQGVGLPLQARTGYSALVSVIDIDDTMSNIDREYRLFTCVKVLMCCATNSALGTMVLTQHLTDILASLMQLNHRGMVKFKESQKQEKDSLVKNVKDCYSSQTSSEKLKQTAVGDDATSDSEQKVKYEKVMSERCRMDTGQDASDLPGHTNHISSDNPDRQTLEVDYRYCKEALTDLVRKVYPPLLVNTLLLLQGGPKPKNVLNKPSLVQVAPVWLRRECGRLLSGIVMRPRGVQSVLRGMLDAPGAGQGMTEASDWRKCDAVAKVIACCPLQSQTVEKYYSLVAPQILELLHIQDKHVCRQFLRVACSVISHMYTQNHSLATTYIIQPLIQPLARCTRENDRTGRVVIGEAELTQCVEDCHKVFVCGCADAPQLVTCLQPVILVLYKLLVFTRHGVSTLRTACHEVVVTFLKQTELPVTLTCLKLMLFEQTHVEAADLYPTMLQQYSFSYTDSGHVTVQTGSDDRSEVEGRSVECIVAVLKDLENTGVPGYFLLYMLQELTSIIHMETGEEVTSKRSTHDLSHLDGISPECQYSRRITLLNTLAAVCETLGPQCIKNAEQTLIFVKATLERGVQICKSTEDVITGTFEGETLTMAMGLLTALMTGAFQLTDSDKQAMQELLPLLQDIATNHPQSSVQEMATDIRIAIATHGAVWSDASKSKEQHFKDISQKVQRERQYVSERKEGAKIEVLPDKSASVKQSEHSESNRLMSDFVSTSSSEQPSSPIDTSHNASCKPRLDVSDTTRTEMSEVSTGGTSQIGGLESELELAFKELCDPLIPVRGHGLIRLTKLVRARDKCVKVRAGTVLKIFEENIEHGDSYIYLSAVNGLSAMCEIYPDISVARVCQLLADQGDTVKNSVEIKMKLGEVMVKTARSLGETVPQYRDVMLRSILVGVKDKESLVRASSLSNLGEMCKLLHFSLGNIVHEVFECCSSIVQHDKDIHVRRAAAQVFTLLLQGMGQHTLQVLESVLREIYRLLKRVLSTDGDHLVKLHVQLALDELDSIMRKQLFPEQVLEKRIRVLDFD